MNGVNGAAARAAASKKESRRWERRLLPGASRCSQVLPGASRCFQARCYALVKLLRDEIELGIERAADRIDAGNDHDRDAGGEQAVFDGGRSNSSFRKAMTLRI